MRLQTRVRIKNRSECENKREYPTYTDTMNVYSDTVTYVQSYDEENDIVRVANNSYNWKPEWLEIVEEPEMNIKGLCPPMQDRNTYTQQDIELINKVGIKDEEIIAQGGTQFSTGAVRSGDANTVMYQLISPIGMRRLAETMKEGFDKYGAYNWERGMPIGDILNHALRHIFQYLSGDRSEDHLAHAAWNLFASMHMEESHPELDHGLRPIKVNTKPMSAQEILKALTEEIK